MENLYGMWKKSENVFVLGGVVEKALILKGETKRPVPPQPKRKKNG